MDFTHAVFIKVDEIIADKVVDNFNDRGYVRDLLCWQVENDAEAGHCDVSSYRNYGTVGVSQGMGEGADDILQR